MDKLKIFRKIFMKQVIVMRKDLKMRKGKMIAQGAHASMAVFFNRQIKADYIEDNNLVILVHPKEFFWIDGEFTKICVSVDSKEELLSIKKQADDIGIPCALITDCGKTEFNGVPTETCIAIGPADAILIDPITGNLPLL